VSWPNVHGSFMINKRSAFNLSLHMWFKFKIPVSFAKNFTEPYQLFANSKSTNFLETADIL